MLQTWRTNLIHGVMLTLQSRTLVVGSEDIISMFSPERDRGSSRGILAQSRRFNTQPITTISVVCLLLVMPWGLWLCTRNLRYIGFSAIAQK